MYRQPVYTGHRPSLEPTFCSALIDKIRLKSYKHASDEKEKPSKPIKNKKPRSENPSGSDKNNPQKSTTKKQQENEIRMIVKKLKRVTGTIPLALPTSDAYEQGKKGCEMCAMNREEYKKMMEVFKIIEILVDGVIEKEQADLIDDDNASEDFNSDRNKSPTKYESSKGKGDKISIQFEVFCERDTIEHNLKCVLIKLQKTIGDTLVQISFVKTRKLGDQERYKKFNAAVSDIKLLKFEYTNLTDKIIPLFKNPPAQKKDSTEICVACMKEKLTDYIERLEEILKSGRNLRLVMRNDSVEKSSDQCCARNYPHVHAEVQGKPIVLKYSMPFQIQNPPKNDSPRPVASDNVVMHAAPVPPDKAFQNPPSENDTWPIKIPSRKSTPYDQWPDEVPEQKYETPEDQPKELPDDNKSVNNPPNEENDWPEKVPIQDSIPHDERPDNHEEQNIETLEDKLRALSMEPSTSAQKPPEYNQVPSKTSKSPGSSLSSKTISKSPGSSLSSKISPLNSKKKSVSDTDDDKANDDDHDDDVNGEELYCGCNSDEVYKKLGIEINQNSSTRGSWPFTPNMKGKDSISEMDTLGTSSQSSGPSYLEDDYSPIPSNTKKVSFYDPKEPTVLPVIVNPSKSGFSRQLSKVDYSPSSVKVPPAPQTPDEKAIDTVKTPFGGDVENVPIYLTTIDSVILAKNRLSISEKHRENIEDFQEDKAVAGAFKPFVNSASDIQRASHTESTSTKTQSQLQLKDISHQNKKVEDVLKLLGKENLLNISSPPDCCNVNNLLVDYGSATNLPLSASLYSLPLDHNDLNYIARATGKHISHEDIMLVPEEEIPVQEYDWEKQYTDEKSWELCQSKWLRAYAGTENPLEHDIDTPTDFQSNSSLAKRGNNKGVKIREDLKLLPTITEEDSYIPYMPSIPSLPLDDEEKNELIRKPKTSILKHKTMELRYFTVEFPNNTVKNKMCEQNSCNRKPKTAQYDSFRSIGLNLNKDHETRANKTTNPLSEGENIQKMSCESFHSCCSSVSELSTELSSVNYDSPSLHDTQPSLLSAVDEMIMLNAIYLCEDNYAESLCMSYLTDCSKPSIGDMTEETSQAIFCNLPKYSQHVEHTIPYTISQERTDETGNLNIKNLFYKDQITEQWAVQNKLCTIINNSEKAINNINTQIFQPSGYKIETSNFQNNRVNKSYTHIENCDKTFSSSSALFYHFGGNNSNKTENNSFTTLKNQEKYTNNEIQFQDQDQIQSNDFASSSSLRINQSYTIINSQNKINDYNDLNVYSNMLNISSSQLNRGLNKSYTLIKENKQQGNLCNTNNDQDVPSQRLGIEKNVLSLLRLPTENFTQSRKITSDSMNKKSSSTNNWSKLKVHSSKIKNFLTQNRSQSSATLKTKETLSKSYKDLKRKPFIPMKSCIDYKRAECKIRLPQLQFAKLRPILAQNEVYSMEYKPNIIFQRVYEVTTNESNTVSRIVDHFINNDINIKTDMKMVTCPKVKYGIQKNYISVKKNLHTVNDIELSTQKCKSTSNYETLNKDSNKNLNILNQGCSLSTVFINNSLTTIKAKHNHPGIFLEPTLVTSTSSSLSSILQSNSASKGSLSSNKIKEYYLLDQNSNPLYLYDIHGRPLSDNSGRPLHNIHGDLLLIFNEVKIPISDADNHPIFDTVGHSINDKDFNPTKPLSSEIFKSFTTALGDPMVLYDVEGRPLTSISGTMLMDSTGEGLIRFGCNGNPVSDSRGKPIFDSNGTQLTS